MSKLAVHGGNPVRQNPFPAYRTIGDEEKNAALQVLDSGILSAFLGSWSPEFLGGPRVRALESDWSAYFGVRHAVSMNSATSGLYAALGAAGIGPGDEVIVSPYTMSASACGPLLYNAIPVFADIDPDTFCLDPASIRDHLTPATKAIVVVDIFGHAAAMEEIMSIAAEHGLVVIEDCAQAPGARSGDRYAGTLGHIGVFSLNYHKHIQCGEGAVVVTDDDNFAERLQLIRNHAEVVLQQKGGDNMNNMLGFNFRMTEIEAAIAAEQLKKLERLVDDRVIRADQLTRRLLAIPGVTPPLVKSQCTHAYYLYVMRFDADVIGVSRKEFVEAVKCEGVPLIEGYVEPIYLQPLYQRRLLFGGTSSPWPQDWEESSVSYDRGICPVTERMHYKEVMFTNAIHAQTSAQDVEDIAEAITKVAAYYTSERA